MDDGFLAARFWIVILAVALLVPACSNRPPAPAATGLTPPRFSTEPAPTGGRPGTLAPTAAAAAPATFTPSVPPSPTPTPHPLTILAMRGREYPGSDIVIEQVLEAGSNYDRFIASYRSEGLKIYALLTIPRGEQPETGWPVIIFNHGYIQPEAYRTTERYVAYVDNLARSGYIVFKSDYRGHGASEGEATGGYDSPGYVVDVLNAVAALQRFPDADPERIGMWGHSMGGYVTLRSMVISPDIKAGVIWAGVVGSYADLVSNWRFGANPAAGATSGFGRRWGAALIETYGLPDENPEFWNSISATAYLADLSGPLQLHHALTDTHVPAAFSQSLYEQALAVGKTVELYIYDSDDHNLTANFTAGMTETIRFFDTHVKGP